MSRNKYKGRAYIILAALLIGFAVILVMVLPQKEPSARRPAKPPAKSGTRPPIRTVRPKTTQVPSKAPPAAPQGAPRLEPSPAQKAQQAEESGPNQSPRDGQIAGGRKPERKRKHPARIALIIDDVGYSSDNLEEYLRIQGKLTFSVLPFLENSEADARVLYEAGFEIMIHIPMEPSRYPSVNPGPHALLVGEPRLAVERKVLSMIDENPYAAGANNHMGSRATQDCELMGWTMDVMKENNLFFVDSRTTGKSCAYELALERNIPTARRDVFLDNTDSAEAITGQFEKLRRIARSKGTAIGIGHINKTHTLDVLKSQLPLLERENISLVFASEAIRDGL